MDNPPTPNSNLEPQKTKYKPRATICCHLVFGKQFKNISIDLLNSVLFKGHQGTLVNSYFRTQKEKFVYGLWFSSL